MSAEQTTRDRIRSHGHTDVEETLDAAIAFTGMHYVAVKHRPRLLSDNGSTHISGQLADYLREAKIQHTRSQPYHPMTQSKIERYHRSLKNSICLDHYRFPGQLDEAIAGFVQHYNQ